MNFRRIADKAGMNSEKAYIYGLLHDIGRRNGSMQARHAIEGFKFLSHIGFDEGARICLTHTFQYKDVEAIYDTWDCSSEEKQFDSNTICHMAVPAKYYSKDAIGLKCVFVLFKFPEYYSMPRFVYTYKNIVA